MSDYEEDWAELLRENTKLTAENERLLGLFKELRAAWFKGGDLDKDHVSQEALRIFIEAERGHQQGPQPKEFCHVCGVGLSDADTAPCGNENCPLLQQ